jgi:16S rRNA (cytosine1402-N4)-methyltransferase
VLAIGGRLAAISFHSLEDRIGQAVHAAQGERDPVWARPAARAGARPASRAMRLVGRKRKPSAAEVAANPRARSAVLRVAEKIAEQGGAPG